MFFFPNEFDLIPILRFSFCIFAGLILFYLEYTKKFQLSYSKFNDKGNINTKTGMLIIYSLPLFIYLYLYVFSNFNSSIYNQLILFFIVFHFGKRCLETLFLHIYSGKISLLTTGFITYSYSSISYSIHQFVNLQPQNNFNFEEYKFVFFISIFIFLAGQLLNLYHHIILRNLRLNNNSKEYIIPNQGLFKMINCPHYLGEIIAWIGICIASKYLFVYGLSFIMSAYLVARSLNTTKWYFSKIENFPKDRKSILPFIL